MSRLVILMYHMIAEPRTEAEKKYACPPQRFKGHLRHLKSRGYRFMSLDSVADTLDREDEFPEKSVAITLDDGYEDNYTAAYPILAEESLPATVFVTTGTVGGTNDWMESPPFSRRRMLTWPQMREMSADGIRFGTHTESHPRLPLIRDDRQLVEEISKPREILSSQLGVPANHFAYPYGLHDHRSREAVESSGYRLACSTMSGFNRRTQDRYLMRRIEVYGTDSPRRLQRKLAFGVNDGSPLRPARYYIRRALTRLHRR